jgi:hypothetical protein
MVILTAVVHIAEADKIRISKSTWKGWRRVVWMRRRGGGLLVFGRC